MATNYITPQYMDLRTVFGTTTNINNGVAQHFNIQYSEEGRRCFPIGVGEYRSKAGWYIHLKGLEEGNCTFDYVNQTGENLTNVRPWVTFLCITPNIY